MRQLQCCSCITAVPTQLMTNLLTNVLLQGGEHNPVDDARAALYIYLKHRKVY